MRHSLHIGSIAQRLASACPLTEDLGAMIIRASGNDVARELTRIAYAQNAGSVVIGHSRHGRLHEFLRGSIVGSLLHQMRDIDVHVVADHREPE